MREKLRLRLTKRKEEQPKKEELERDGLEDNRKVEDLLQFINSGGNKPASSAKAAKRARHKQKKVKTDRKTRPVRMDREYDTKLRGRFMGSIYHIGHFVG